MITQPSAFSPNYRKMVRQTSATSQRKRQNLHKSLCRPQTTMNKERLQVDDGWKKTVTCKMDDLMNTTNVYFRKCQ